MQQDEAFAIEIRRRQLLPRIVDFDLVISIIAHVLGPVPATLRRDVDQRRRTIGQKLELRSKRIVRGMFQRLLSGFSRDGSSRVALGLPSQIGHCSSR